jgi:hypothetical protein
VTGPIEDRNIKNFGEEDGEGAPSAMFKTALTPLFTSLDLNGNQLAGTFHVYPTPVCSLSPASSELNTPEPTPKPEPLVMLRAPGPARDEGKDCPEEVVGSAEWAERGVVDSQAMRKQIEDLYAAARQAESTAPRLAHAPDPTMEHQMHYKDFPALRCAAAKLAVLSKSKKIDVVFRACLAAMHATLNLFLDPRFNFSWRTCSIISASLQGFKGKSRARNVRTWIHNLIHFDRLPYHGYMGNTHSMLDNEEFLQGLQMFLLETVKGRPIHAEDMVTYVASEEVQQDFGWIKICACTGARWLMKLGWRYGLMKNSMFSNGHERIDVIVTREGLTDRWFVKYKPRMTIYDNNGNVIPLPDPAQLELVLVTHDEPTFHAQDCRQSFWIPPDPSHIPHPKGEGASIMVSDFLTTKWG